MEVIVGTAGHIDHGKTALVKALTGIDADRLPEEKRRGITVDLGFAETSIGDTHFGFVDVPGHERFVKNMLAGASGIDLVILVIAANEGVMPQTREHFDICRLLGIKAGIIALTKVDLVDAETLELAKLDVAELVTGSFLESSPVVSVSSKSNEGIGALKDALKMAASGLTARNDQYVTRLPIDRSFSMKGFGAVVTGTLASGKISDGSEMELLPISSKVRVRGVQSHGKPVASAYAGQRVAVNLGGIDHANVTRGMVLTEPNILRTTQMLDVEMEVLSGVSKPISSRQRVRLHIGTIEALARIQVLNSTGEIAAGGKDFVQLRLEGPVLAIPGERFIVRRYSPQATIAGGEVIDAFPAKHRKVDFNRIQRDLSELQETRDDLAVAIPSIMDAAPVLSVSLSDLQARTGRTKSAVMAAIDSNIKSKSIVDCNGRYLLATDFEELKGWIEAILSDFHESEPLAKGMSRESLRDHVCRYHPSEVFLAALAELESQNKIILDNEMIRLSSYKTKLSSAETDLKDKIFKIYKNAGLEVPRLDDALAEAVAETDFAQQEARKYFQLLLDDGDIVKVTDEFYFFYQAIDRLVATMREYADGTSDRLIDVAKFKEIAGVSRKYAIPLLEYLDQTRITRRAGAGRVVL